MATQTAISFEQYLPNIPNPDVEYDRRSAEDASGSPTPGSRRSAFKSTDVHLDPSWLFARIDRFPSAE